MYKSSLPLLLSIFFFVFGNIYAQNINTDSVSHVNFTSLHDTYLNDIWGHVDVAGNEYALVGCRKGTSIISLINPQQPIEVFWEPGTESVWRDVNTYQQYAYVTTEAEDGLLILDLNSLPNANGITTHYYTGPSNNQWQSAHTLFVDSLGYAYIFGANRGNGGVIILDIHTNPLQPIEIGIFDNWYAHDGYVRGDTLYLAHISDGFISIVDISDRSNPVLLGTKNTPNNFSHNIWTDYSAQIAYTTDEVSGAYVASYDISNPQEITLLDQIQSSPGLGIIPHNVQFLNDFLVCSYYADGVVVFDATNPRNLIQVANYDTYPGNSIHYDGCWSSYPFLPSGLVIAADITQGMFVFQVNYQKSARIEGFTYNQETNQALSDVQITITNSSHIDFSKTDGYYGSGTINSGLQQVTFQKVGFYPQTFEINLTQGEAWVQDVYLVPIPPFTKTVKVFDSETQIEILDAKVGLISSLTEDYGTSNGLGEIIFTLYYQENYQLIAGKWGYLSYCNEVLINENSGTIEVFLTKGLEDDFSLDLGWTSYNDNATSGQWVRENPNPTSIFTAPENDVSTDCGEKAFITGNNANLDSNFDDVDNGEVILISPTFDLSTVETPFIHYSRWYFNLWGPLEVDDTLKIYLSNGFQTVLVDYQTSDENVFYKWIDKAIKVKDFIFPTENMNLIIKISDFEPNGNITESGIDHFFVDTVSHLVIKENSLDYSNFPQIYPNPSKDEIFIKNPEVKNWKIYDLHFKLIKSGNFSDLENKIDIEQLNSGVYFFKNGRFTIKFVKFD
ncbi:MAG: choice-of-anchor B family protein [Flavobacteriia bacterium]|nr:choice-of-anchor B family protein [Flavobacteriia bacterium]